MSLKHRLAKLLLFGVLEIGALVGVPMSPRQIEEIMNVMNRTVVQVRVDKKKDGDP